MVNVVFLLLSDSPVSEVYVLSFRNTLSAPYSYNRVLRNVRTEKSDARESSERNYIIIYKYV